MKKLPAFFALPLLIATLSQTRLSAQPSQDALPTSLMTTTDSVEEESAPAHLAPRNSNYVNVEKDLNTTVDEESSTGEVASIETSHPYLLPRLFTLPTAYSLQSYELRFGGQGNIHSTVANFSTQEFKSSLSLGLGGIMELGYELGEYYTVQNISDKILMGYFKLSLLKESKFLPAASISASKNLRSSFRPVGLPVYTMDEDLYEVVFSKTFHIGESMLSLHPGAQIIRDHVTAIAGMPDLGKGLETTKVNPRLGLSWQSRPKTLFMYELKVLHPTDVSSMSRGSIQDDLAMENNLGIRYYIRNWLCMDSGIRHFYNINSHEDEMKLHANFVGVIPMAVVYDRVQNYFKK
jgi:hypothetical protein